ncbi:MAG: hypothetical protein Q7S22_08290 [Candidatus Micrarchaeota archaeon]|nr:hypothetical protein [Candidatus Micrarchaeota archaeon]
MQQQLRFIRPERRLTIKEIRVTAARAMEQGEVALASEKYPIKSKVYGNDITDHMGLFNKIAYGNFRAKYGGEQIEPEEFFSELVCKTQERWESFDPLKNKSRAAFIYFIARGVLSQMLVKGRIDDGKYVRKAVNNFRHLREEMRQLRGKLEEKGLDLIPLLSKYETTLKVFEEMQRTMTVREMAMELVLKKYEIPKDAYLRANEARKGEMSLDAQRKNRDGEDTGTFMDSVLVDRETPDNIVADGQLKDILRSAIRTAIENVLAKRPKKERDLEIIGVMADGDEESFADIGRRYVISRARIGQVRDQLKAKIRTELEHGLAEHGGAARILELISSQ